MRLGWLADPPSQIIGGAELCVEQLARDRPAGVEIVPCPPGGIVRDVDAYAVHNCTRYTLAEFLTTADRTRPILKLVYEQWWHGDPALRAYFLATSALALFLSPPHLVQFPHRIQCPTGIMPTIVDLEPFRDLKDDRRRGTMWLGQMTSFHKGVEDAVGWAVDHGETVDFYGGGWMRPPDHPNVRDHGQVPHDEVPALMAAHERFLFLPTLLDTCSRTIFEAWASGMELVTNENVGATWWIENAPELIETGSSTFWEHATTL